METEHNKTITFSELSDFFFKTYCMPKIMRDVDKNDPLTRDIHNLVKRKREERDERKKAYWIWNDNRTSKNATAYLEEIADEINFLLFQAGKALDYERMKRE